MTSNRGEVRDQVRVLALIDHFVLGGAETLLPRFAAAAPEAGIQLSIACLEELDGNPAAAPLYDLGTPPVNLDLPGRPGLRALHRVRSLVARVRPEIVHTHLGTSDIVGGLAARSLGIPAISTIHAMRWDRSASLRRPIVRFAATRVIAVSDSARREYLRRGWARPNQIVTIHNGIDVRPVPGAGRDVRRELGFAPDDFVLGMVSALRPEKGHDVALEVMRILRPRYPQLRLLILGQGGLREEIVRRSADLGDTVVLGGLCDDVMRVLDAVDVCLQPSHADAFPTSVIEAMAASVPVVASAVGGIPELLSDGRTGVLVPTPPEAAVVADAVGRLLDDPLTRQAMAAVAHRDYIERFTAGPWVRGTRALYDDVLAEASASRIRAPRIRARRPGRPSAALGRRRI